jgi:hypothetical protein
VAKKKNHRPYRESNHNSPAPNKPSGLLLVYEHVKVNTAIKTRTSYAYNLTQKLQNKDEISDVSPYRKADKDVTSQYG